MRAEEFDVVELIDEREVAVVYVYEDHSAYEVEDAIETSKADYDGEPSFTVYPNQIKRVVKAFKG